MVRLSDCMAIVHYPSILLVPFSALYGNLQLRYKQFCWYLTSFFIDFSLIYNDFINTHTTKVTDVYISDHMVIEHCPSNHLNPIIALYVYQ